FESLSGRYRVTRIVAMSWLILLVDTLLWFPACYRDRAILDPRGPGGLVCHGVLEKVGIVPFRIVGPVVGSPRFSSLYCRVGYRLCNVYHKVEFYCGDEFRVVDVVLVFDYGVLESRLEVADYSAAFFEAGLVSVDSYVLLHPVLHLCPDAGYSLALFMLEQLVEDPLLLHHGLSLDGVSEARTLQFHCVSGCGSACGRAEDKTLSQGVASQPVSTVHTDTRYFAGCI